MVFEDMQWADASLLDFIEYLLEWSRNSPIYVVTHARPELLERRPTWGAGKRNFTSIYLEPLSEQAMQALLAGLVPGLPEGLRAQILARAEGIPLYAVETVRMLLDRGALVQDGATYRLTGTVESLEVPETLHALIAARLDGLPAEERRVIQDAAVLGKTFTKHALAALAGLPEAELDPVLSSLTRKEVLGVQSDPRSPEHGQYGFLQDLLRKVAYDTLARADRKARHLAAAALLEEGWSEHEVVEVVASHYLAAYHAAPDADDANEIKERARDRLARAGDRAASLGANEEAERYYTQAAELADDTLVRAELYERAGRTAWKRARAAEATSHFERAIADFEALGLTHPAARASAALAEITWQEGSIEDAIARMEAAFAVLSEEKEDDEDLATIAAQLGRLLFFAGRLGDALDRIESALSLAEALALPEVFAQALQTKGNILGALGRPEEGLTLTEKALQVALEHDLSSVALRAYSNLQAFMSDLDRLKGAPALTAEGLALARRAGDRLGELSTMAIQLGHLVAYGSWSEAVALGDELRALPDLPAVARLELMMLVPVLVRQGQLGAAREVLQLLPEGESSGDVQTRTLYHTMLATVLRAEGRLDDAIRAADVAYAGRTELGFVLPVKESIVEGFEAAFALGDTSKCSELLEVLEALRPGESTPYVRAQRTRLRARLDGSDTAFKASVVAFRELGWPFWLGVVLVEHAEWLAVEGRVSQAEPLLSEAREIFEQLEARPWLERVDAQAEVHA
jgi:tetratricopeptide (TPR) repeat protein